MQAAVVCVTGLLFFISTPVIEPEGDGRLLCVVLRAPASLVCSSELKWAFF